MNYKILSTETVFKGRVFDIQVDQIEYDSGTPGVREIAIHHGGAVVLPVNPEGKIVMVRQFRYPIDQWLLELPAGKLNKGEDPYLCAVRELKEETGYTAEKVVKLGAIVTTPGFCSERLHIYAAFGLSAGDHEREEGEHGMSMIELSMQEIEQKISAGEIIDSKTLSGILMYKIQYEPA
ncbi:MAG: NUDIX hydrolase [Ignavibacteriales bacterium]|nr:NUDIX hydrolase [Ignavibacteriales bacterium]